MIALSELVALRVEDVLNDPLSREAVRIYTGQLFYGNQLVRSCDSSIKIYFRRLQIEGLTTQKKLQMAKYTLEPGKVLRYGNQMYNSSTMTDEIAEAIIAQFPDLKKEFKIKEDAEVEAPKGPKKPRVPKNK